jgi:hypothetical protein
VGLHTRSLEAVNQFREEVQQGTFPTEANTFTRIRQEEAETLAEWVDQGIAR